MIFVSGAGGFIGGRTVEVLLTQKRYSHIRAGVRAWASAARIARYRGEIVKADLLNGGEVSIAVKNMSYVIHCAYGSDGTTVDGTRNLLQAALDANVKKFIHLSTISVYRNPQGTIDETYLVGATDNDYGDSKFEAERLCWEYSKKGLPVVILRLPIVYGPFSRNWTVHISEMLLQRKLGKIEGFGEGKCNLLFVDDAVDAIVHCIESDRGDNMVFNVNGPEVISWNEYFEIFNNALGLPPLERVQQRDARIKAVVGESIRIAGRYVQRHHMGLVKSLAAHSQSLDRLLRTTEQHLRSTPALSELKLYDKEATYSSERLKTVLGFSARTPVRKGVAISSEWLKEQGVFWYEETS